MNKKELREILTLHQKWLNGDEDGKQANLVGANLKGTNLEWANLEEANLKEANLEWANLIGTILCDCKFENTRISYRGKTAVVNIVVQE